MRTFKFDIMLNGRFVCTLRYKYCALFPIFLMGILMEILAIVCLIRSIVPYT